MSKREYADESLVIPLEEIDAAILALGAVSAGRAPLPGSPLKRRRFRQRSRRLHLRLSSAAEVGDLRLRDRDIQLVQIGAAALLEDRRSSQAQHYNPDLGPELIELINRLNSTES